MSEFYDQFHRWEPLAEFHFSINDEEDMYDDDNYMYCLCSRVFIRDFVKTYYDRKEASESEAEVEHALMPEIEDHSHVHFSVDTSYKVKCDKEESASCYCSASHTENYCSTDEHDPAQVPSTPHLLQPSDSGADLTYQDSHSEFPIKGKQEKINKDELITENYLSEDTWETFWAVNGERIIWASWIKNYSDYINPSYLDENNDLIMQENTIPKPKSSNDINAEVSNLDESQDNDSPRERKFSYDSKVNPYKKSISNQSSFEKKNKTSDTKDESWLPGVRRRSFSEHDRMLSPRTVGTDSMTNVTKITLSSYDVTSSHVTSESSPTEDYSVSSSTSEDQSNDKTRIAMIYDNIEDVPLEDFDTEQYWQLLWKKHFGEQYALHYANYIETHNYQSSQPLPMTCDQEATKDELDIIETKYDDKIDNAPEFVEDKDCVDSYDYSSKLQATAFEISQLKNIDTEVTQIENEQDMFKYDTVKIDCENLEDIKDSSSLVEVQEKVDQIDLKDKEVFEKVTRPKRRNKKASTRYIGSVGYLLQNLLKDQVNSERTDNTDAPNVLQTSEGAENDNNQTKSDAIVVAESNVESNVAQNTSNNDIWQSFDCNNEDDDDPPEEKAVTLKRSHEIEDEVNIPDKIKTTFSLMGFCMNPEKMPKGEVVYRKRFLRVRNHRYKRPNEPKKTYYDDDGNAYQAQDSNEEREMQTDDDCQTTNCDIADESGEVNKSLPFVDESISTEDKIIATVENNPKEQSNVDAVLEASKIALPLEIDSSSSDVQDKKDEQKTESTSDFSVSCQVETKRRRRQKRYKVEEAIDESELPDELKGDPKMLKYWKKRHSLFHRFDEGIKLDRESWFSVTPENVAWHIANKYEYDVVVDAFCGAGGNTIQFARTSKKVIAIDIDPLKIELAQHNAKVYGVAEKIEFVVGDFFELAHKFEADMVFLSPPWGGPNYSENFEYDLETMLIPKPASQLMKVASSVAPSVAMYLPRNSKTDQILALAKEAECSVEIEQSYLDRRFVAITAYFY